MIDFVTGNIFESKAEALVNPVNCVGVMGKGLALKFKLKFQDNFLYYQEACKNLDLRIGKVLVFDMDGSAYRKGILPKFIINFPTKNHWRDNSVIGNIDSGLIDLARAIKKHAIKSIAIPALGAGLGGLEWEDVKPLIQNRMDLEGVSVSVYIPH